MKIPEKFKRPKIFSLEPEWPESLPEKCSKCDSSFDIRSSLKVGLCRPGRFLRKLAPWMIVVNVFFIGLGGSHIFNGSTAFSGGG
jgi:hypothetical protein